MLRYINTITIPVPLLPTFEYVSNFAHAGSWDPRVSTAQRTDGDGPLGVGATFLLQSPGLFGMTIDFPYEIIRYTSPSRVTFEGRTWAASYRDDLRFEAIDDASTQLTYDAEFELRGLLKLGRPIMKVFFQRIGDDATRGIADAVVRGTGGQA